MSLTPEEEAAYQQIQDRLVANVAGQLATLKKRSWRGHLLNCLAAAGLDTSVLRQIIIDKVVMGAYDDLRDADLPGPDAMIRPYLIEGITKSVNKRIDEFLAG